MNDRTLADRVTPPLDAGLDDASTRERPAAEEVKAKVVLLGAPGVGKTSLVRRFVLNEFDDRYRMTLGANVYKWTASVDVADHPVHVTMTLWDTMGESEVADALRDVYLLGAQGILAVCDVTDETSVTPLGEWIDEALRFTQDIPVHILMNKVDLGPRADVRDAALRVGLDRAAPCFLTSAKAGSNVVAAFDDLARRIVERAIVPEDGPLDAKDERIVIDCSAGPATPWDLARDLGMPPLLAEARLERLRRRGFLCLARLALDAAGRPDIAYTRTGRPFADLLRIRPE